MLEGREEVFWGVPHPLTQVTRRQAGLLMVRGMRVARPCPCRSLAADEKGWQRPAGRKKKQEKPPKPPPSLVLCSRRPSHRREGRSAVNWPRDDTGEGKKKMPLTVPGSFFPIFFFFCGGEEPGSSYKHISQQANTTQIHFRACYEAFDPNQMIFPPLPPTSLMGIGGNLPHPESVWRTKRSF